MSSAHTTGSDSAELEAHGPESYWTNRWKLGQTGWKALETAREDGSNFAYSLFRHYIAETELISKTRRALFTHGEMDEIALGQQLAEKESSLVESVLNAASGAPLRLRVLVPLCGDSWATSYFSDQWRKDLISMVESTAAQAEGKVKTDSDGASRGRTFTPQLLELLKTRLVVDVVGIDLAKDSLATVRSRFPIPFRSEKLTVESAAPNQKSVTLERYHVPLEHGSLTLYEGDFFVAMESVIAKEIQEKKEAPFDLIYDRASFVAISASLRARYIEAVVSCVRAADEVVLPSIGIPFPTVVLELMLRPPNGILGPDGLPNGPPFHINPDDVPALYYTPTRGFSIPPQPLSVPPPLQSLHQNDTKIAALTFRPQSFAIFRRSGDALPKSLIRSFL